MSQSRKRLLGLVLSGTLLIQVVLWSSVALSVWLGDSGGFFAGFGVLLAAALVLGVLKQDDLAPAFLLSIVAALFIGPISGDVMALVWSSHAELGPEGIRGDPSARCLTVVEGILHPRLRGHATTPSGPRAPASSTTVAPLVATDSQDGSSARVWLVVKKHAMPEVMPRHVHRPRNLPSMTMAALQKAGASGAEPLIVIPGACAERVASWLPVFQGVVGVYSLLWPVGLLLLGLRRPAVS